MWRGVGGGGGGVFSRQGLRETARRTPTRVALDVSTSRPTPSPQAVGPRARRASRLAPALALSTHSPLYLLRILYYLYLIFKSTSGKYIHFNLCDCVLIYVHFFTQCLFIYFFLNIILCYILCFILCKLNYSQKSSGIFVH